jgi:transposase
MSPIPEKVPQPSSMDSLMELYTGAAKAHNLVLAEHLAALARIAALEKQLEWLKRQMFGTSSEKLHSNHLDKPEQDGPRPGDPGATDQGSGDPNYSTGPGPEIANDSNTQDSQAGGMRKPTSRIGWKKAGHGWGKIPADLPRVDVIVPLTDEQQELLKMGVLIKIRDEITERIAVHPKTLYVKRFFRPLFARLDAQGNRTVLPLAPIDSPIEKGRADLSILAFLIVSKFLDHLPLDRIRKIFLRQGHHLATSTMVHWLSDLHELLRPIYLAMITELKAGNLIHADETICRVMVNEKAIEEDKKKHKTHPGYLWVYIGSGHILYEYTHSRGSEHPLRFLTGSFPEQEFHGTLQGDGYAGYNAICKKNKLVRAGCHAHARRYFMEALPKYPFVKEFLEMYTDLFNIEAQCTEQMQSAEERLKIRERRSGPLLARMHTWVENAAQIALPQDALGEAVTYFLGQWEELKVFLKNGRIPLDNNISERALRPVVLGRNNFLYFGSEKGAERGATFYSLVQSCAALGINPLEYLEDVLGRIDSHPNRRITELTPAGWKAVRNKATIQ